MATFDLTVTPCDMSDTPIEGFAPLVASFVLHGGNPGLTLTNVTAMRWDCSSAGRLAHLRCVGKDGEYFSLPCPVRYAPHMRLSIEPGALRLDVQQSYDPSTLSYRWS